MTVTTWSECSDLSAKTPKRMVKMSHRWWPMLVPKRMQAKSVTISNKNRSRCKKSSSSLSWSMVHARLTCQKTMTTLLPRRKQLKNLRRSNKSLNKSRSKPKRNPRMSKSKKIPALSWSPKFLKKKTLKSKLTPSPQRQVKLKPQLPRQSQMSPLWPLKNFTLQWLSLKKKWKSWKRKSTRLVKKRTMKWLVSFRSRWTKKRSKKPNMS